MKNGVHTIRSGFSTDSDPIAPRRYTLDNGNYQLNMKITSLHIMPGVDPGQLDMGNSQIQFVVALDEAGATPLDGTTDFHQGYQFRFDDSSQIAWGCIDGASGGIIDVIVDPQHIIPSDIWVNAWMIDTGASPTQLTSPINFMIVMEQFKESGAEALLSQIKEISS